MVAQRPFFIGMGRRIEAEADDLLEFVGKCGVVGDLERAHPMRLEPCPFHIRRRWCRCRTVMEIPYCTKPNLQKLLLGLFY
jgi:hypothetical protein